MEAARYSQLQRHNLYTGLAKIVALFNILAELKERQQPKRATIQTPEELQFYLMLIGAYGREGKLAAWSTIMRYPELAVHVGREDSVARQQEPKPIAELRRDQSGFVHQVLPQTNNRESNSQNKPYKNNPYSYTPYSKAKIYLKSASKKMYSRIEEEVEKLFSRIRSVYQSASGVIRSRKQYEGKNEVRVIRYNSPESNLEERIAT